MTSPDPDYQLFAREGCGHAFRRLVDRHVHAVHRTASQVLGAPHHHLAEDVTQEVFLKLARRPPDRPDRMLVLPWLHRQTVRLALNTVRAERRRGLRERRAAAADEPETSEDGGEVWSELRPRLHQALLELRETDRQAVLLWHFEKRDLRSIGETLGVSPAAAQKRISRSMEALRAKFTRRGIHVSAAALTGWISAESASGAPEGLAATIESAAVASVHGAAATTTSGGMAGILLTMSKLKASLIGALLGGLTGGVWIWASGSLPSSSAADTQATGFPARRFAGSEKTPAETAAAARNRVPPLPADMDGLLALLRPLLREGDNEITRLRLRGLLAKMNPKDFATLLGRTGLEFTPNEREILYPVLASVWGAVSPAEAMAAMLPLRAPMFFRAGASSLTGIVFREWHQTDRAGARLWLADHSEDPVLRQTVGGMIAEVGKSLLEESPEALVDWARRLDGGKYRDAALDPLIRGFAFDESKADHSADLRRLLTQFSSGADPEFSRRAADLCANLWTYHRKEELAKVLAELPPSDAAWSAALRFHARLARPVSMDRANLALRLAGDRPQAEAVSEIVRRSSNPTPELMAWALPKLEGAARDETLVFAARRQSDGEFSERPEAEWRSFSMAEQLTDPSLRGPMLYGLYQNALKQTPEKAAAFLRTSQLAEESKNILRKAAAEMPTAAPKP